MIKTRNLKHSTQGIGVRVTPTRWRANLRRPFNGIG